MAFVYGRLGDGTNVPARLHRVNLIADMFGGAKPVHAALRHFKREGRGVIIVLRDGTAGVPIHAIPHNGDTASDAARTRQWRISRAMWGRTESQYLPAAPANTLAIAGRRRVGATTRTVLSVRVAIHSHS